MYGVACGRRRRHCSLYTCVSSAVGKSSFIIGFAAATITVSVWAWFNQPDNEPSWPTTIQGFAFSPFRANQDAITHKLPTDAEIISDLRLLAGKTYAVRTYTVEGSLADIPSLARRYHINVALGAWIDKDQKQDAAYVARAIAIAKHNPNVVRVIIGNEAVLRGDVSTEELIPYLDEARKEIQQPVSTAEPWYTWIQHPELVAHVDYIAVHMLPYWEGVGVGEAVPYIAARMQDLEKAYPGKPIVIAEVGWPSDGRSRHAAVASTANEATFLRRFLAYATAQHWTYYIMEAFDQPWKEQTEGAVGAYWGVYDVYRQPKFTFTQPIVSIPHWQLLAATSVIFAVMLLTLLYWDSRTLKKRGRSFLAIIVYTVTTAVVWVIYDYTRQYLTIANVAVGLLLFVGMIGVILVLLAEAHEWAEAHWITMRRRVFEPLRISDDALPMVSIHVPAYNEPPEMLKHTLDALAALDYPRYEVLVIDNNTPNEDVWQPVEAYCAKLGSRFRFYHVAPLEGFKAGALNYALRHTVSGAAVIAVIDSDYQVKSDWLSELVPLFADNKIAVVQAPQDYRDAELNAFKAMCYAEYRGFFYIGMITRNERNAIIQHGTMTMIRKTVLEKLQGWAEWCITEDAELGLRVFEAGLEAAYIPRSYGRGLMPDTFLDYKKQRFRWAYGAVQILRRHAVTLMGRDSPLTLGQRYHFLAGWLAWLSDGLNLLFNLCALLWSLAMIDFPHKIDPPMLVVSALPLTLFNFKIAKLVYLYRTRVGANIRQTLAAALAGLALTHTIGLATLSGFLTSNKPFFRTPKLVRSHALLRALAESREESLIMLALWLCAFAVSTQVDSGMRDLTVWVIVLLIQSIPYCASLVMALLSSLTAMPASIIGRAENMDVLAQLVLDTESMQIRN
jgi:exo-beta-1,3-glucanase (GH17 family)/cellulose synthase/poly-beta-1,6-N-acetylglucosamine synthase-like glycosyltransferase